MPKWFYFTILAVALLTLAVGGWVVKGSSPQRSRRGASSPGRPRKVRTMANLTGSWLAFPPRSRPVRIERMRREGELYAVRNDSGEWEYGLAVDAAGELRPAVAEFLASARRKIAPAELSELLERRVGLAGGKRVRDLLLNGGDKNAFSDARRANTV